VGINLLIHQSPSNRIFLKHFLKHLRAFLTTFLSFPFHPFFLNVRNKITFYFPIKKTPHSSFFLPFPILIIFFFFFNFYFYFNFLFIYFILSLSLSLSLSSSPSHRCKNPSPLSPRNEPKLGLTKGESILCILHRISGYNPR
jgi:hypothetical protein